MDVDPFDEGVLADPVGLHTAIREAAPAVWVPRYQAWFTARDAEAREVLTDWERFSSASGVGVANIRRVGSWQKPSVILEVDPPDHGVTRRVLSRILSPRAMRDMRTEFERFAAELVDELVERREFDAMADLAFRFPFTVLPDAVGTARRQVASTWCATARCTSTPACPRRRSHTRRPRQRERRGASTGSAARCRRDELAPGGFGRQIYAAADAGEISDETAATLVRTFLGGGVDTTVLSLGALVHLLATHPDQWRLLRERRDLVRNAFDEGLRLCPSVPIIGRTTTTATKLGGVSLGAEEKIFCLILAANRDPRRWERGDEFDIERRTAGQLGFGVGPHFCVGHAVARLEAEVVLDALLDRVGTIEITGEPTPEVNNWLYGLRHLPVRVTPLVRP